MKNVLVLGVAALALVGCGSKEEAAVPAETPVVEENVEAGNGGVPQDTAVAPEGAQVVVGEPSSSEPAKEPTVVYPAE